MSKDKKDKEMICGLTADQRDLLQQELRELPEVMPPRDVWLRIREQAEAEGLDRIFKAAGAQWRFVGCSMCLGMNPDQLRPQQRCASTSNRNFEGRQGAGARTILASPATAAA